MTKLTWDANPTRYETGVDRGVVYPIGGSGEAWNGLISVQESPSDVDVRPRYQDGQKFGNRGRRGEFSANVEAYTYPPSLERELFTNRPRPFGLSYRTNTEFGYKIHVVYNVLLTPATGDHTYSEASTFTWSLSTRALSISEGLFVSHFVIDSSIAYPATILAMENVLYGDDSFQPSLPSPDDVLNIFEETSV